MKEKLYRYSLLTIIFFPAAYGYILYLFVRDFLNKEIDIKGLFSKERIVVLISFIAAIIFSEYKVESLAHASLYLMAFSSYIYFDKNFKLDIDEYVSFVLKITALTMIIGVAIYLFPINTMPAKWVDSDLYNIQNRMFSTFFNPNIYGYYLSMITLLVTSLIIRESSNTDCKMKKSHVFLVNSSYMLTILFFCLALCLYFTYSRTAWIALFISLLLLSLIADKKYIKYALSFALTIAVLDLLFHTNRSDLGNAIHDSSVEYRLELWRIGFKIIKDHLMFGIGFGTYNKYTSLYSTVVTKYIEHSHNAYMEAILSFGVMPISCILTVYYKRICCKMKALMSAIKNSYAIFMIGVIIFSVIANLFDAVIITPQIFMIVILLSIVNKKSNFN